MPTPIESMLSKSILLAFGSILSIIAIACPASIGGNRHVALVNHLMEMGGVLRDNQNIGLPKTANTVNDRYVASRTRKRSLTGELPWTDARY